MLTVCGSLQGRSANGAALAAASVVAVAGGALVDDFVVSRTERAVHVRNAPSPAATSCLPLARLIADELDAALE